MSGKGAGSSSGSIIARSSAYISESVDELKKVHTPTRQEATRLTGVVLLISVFISMCLFVMDLTFNWLMTEIVG